MEVQDVDLNKAREINEKIGLILQGQQGTDVIVALAMTLINISISQEISFKKTIKDVNKIEQLLRVKT